MHACSVNRSCWLGSAESRPNSVLDTIGKIEMITHTRTREPNPKPKMLPMSGTMARIGMAWAAIRYGQNERSTQFAWAMRTARSIPRTIEMASPVSATPAVHHSACSMSPRTAASRYERSTTVAGEGRRKLGLSNSARMPHVCISHHKPMNRTNPISGPTMSIQRRPSCGACGKAPGTGALVGAGVVDASVACRRVMRGPRAGRG